MVRVAAAVERTACMSRLGVSLRKGRPIQPLLMANATRRPRHVSSLSTPRRHSVYSLRVWAHALRRGRSEKKGAFSETRARDPLLISLRARAPGVCVTISKCPNFFD